MSKRKKRSERKVGGNVSQGTVVVSQYELILYSIGPDKYLVDS